MSLIVYLSGEIHTDWRQKIIEGANQQNLDIRFTSAVTNHDASDAAGDHLGEESTGFWRDHKSAKINAIRTKTLIEKSDLVVVRFGEKYKQWNAAFDAGYAAALNTPLIVMHDGALTHPLKEVDGAALAVAETADQIVRILRYVIKGELKD